MFPSSFPPEILQTDFSFPPPGPRGARSPASGTTRSSDALRSFPPRFVAFAWRYRSRALSSLSQPRARLLRAWAVCRLPSDSRAENAGPPRFLGDPHCAHAEFCDPGGTSAPAMTVLPCCLPPMKTASAPANHSFRGSITQPAHSLCTLRSTGYPATTQHSVPAGGQPFAGQDLFLPGSQREVSALSLHRVLLSQALPGAPSREASAVTAALALSHQPSEPFSSCTMNALPGLTRSPESRTPAGKTRRSRARLTNLRIPGPGTASVSPTRHCAGPVRV
jgi:hypothetical protein